MKKLQIALCVLVLAGCSTQPQRPMTEAELAHQREMTRMGLQMLMQARPQPQPMRAPIYCRSVQVGNAVQTVCD